VADPKALSVKYKVTYNLTGPGPVADRQEAPHEHDAVLDPTKKFIMVPDLGADLVRIFKADSGASATPLSTVKAVPASGPRHCGFSVLGNNTYFYTANELSNTVTGYHVTYKGDDAPEFTRLFDFSTHGPGGTVPKGTKAAELVISVSRDPNQSPTIGW